MWIFLDLNVGPYARPDEGKSLPDPALRDTNLFVQHKDESVVSRAKGGERLQVIDDSLAGREVVPTNVAHHPVQVLGVLLGEVAIGIGQDESPQRISVCVRQLEAQLGRGGRFFGFDDVAWQQQKIRNFHIYRGCLKSGCLKSGRTLVWISDNNLCLKSGWMSGPKTRLVS